ncbi:MAG: hypothetical protein EA366_10010 [Spirulina sp. DLM2.Bin59]|nr:MAG: hypothetical protein EA366_10010 [Spirulina sp. DLM2.Bin59]
MTFVDDLMDEQEQEASPYPNVMGLSLTPAVGGGLVFFLGIAGAAAIMYFLAIPTGQELAELKSTVDQKELERSQLQEAEARIGQLEADLAVTRADQQGVLSLFAGEEASQTLLATVSQQVENSQGNLLRFTPPTAEPQIVEEGQWGPDVNGLLKTQTLQLQLEAGFSETMTILRNIERLQALVAVKSITSEVATQEERQLLLGGEVTTTGGPLLTTNLSLELLYPVSAAELAATEQEADPDAEPPVE